MSAQKPFLPSDTPTYVTALFKRIGDLERARRETGSGQLAKRLDRLEKQLATLAESHGTMADYLRQELAEVRIALADGPATQTQMSGSEIDLDGFAQRIYEARLASDDELEAAEFKRTEARLIRERLLTPVNPTPTPKPSWLRRCWNSITWPYF